jgi:dynein heavy chain
MKAIKGIVLLSYELDQMMSNLLKNRVPANWEQVSYLSLKPLASWIKDLK